MANNCSNSSPYPFCGDTHCNSQEVSDTSKATCEANGWGRDVKIVSRKPDGTCCYCWCSCAAYGTLVLTGTKSQTKEIQLIEKGETVLTVAQQGEEWRPRSVEHSAGSPSVLPDGTVPSNGLIYRIEFDKRVLIVNPSHLFWVVEKSTGKRKLVRADRLYPNLFSLISVDFEEVRIDSVWYGSYAGGVWGIGTNRADTSINAHLIGMNGVICGDYFLQTSFVEENNALKDELLILPQIGSAEFYLSEHYFEGLSGSYEKVSASDEKFTPHIPISKRQSVMEKSVLPKWAEEPIPDFQGAMDDTEKMLKAMQVEALFKGFYPDINFIFNWNDKTVNAYARVKDGKKEVEMLGGMIRHTSMNWQGIAFVYAHEVGHHYAGSPQYPSPNDWASCEGQADYWASLVSLRKVYPGEEYLDVAFAAADQFHDLLGKLGSSISLEEQQQYFTESCTHPPKDCRKDTIIAGIELRKKPTCAG